MIQTKLNRILKQTLEKYYGLSDPLKNYFIDYCGLSNNDDYWFSGVYGVYKKM